MTSVGDGITDIAVWEPFPGLRVRATISPHHGRGVEFWRWCTQPPGWAYEFHSEHSGLIFKQFSSFPDGPTPDTVHSNESAIEPKA